LIAQLKSINHVQHDLGRISEADSF